MALYEVTSQNVKHASTLTLLRIRAREVRAQYVRMSRCYATSHVQPFVYDSHQGNCDIEEKISNLRKYIIDHIKVIENLRILVDRCKTSRSRLKRANRSGGYLTRLLRERNGAVVDELMARYEMTVDKVVENFDGGTKCDTPADKSAVVHATSFLDAFEGGEEPHVQQESGAQVQTTAVIVPAATPGVDANAQTDYNGLYAVQRRCTTIRNQRMLDMHEAGITKPSRGDKLITARALAYLRGYIDGVQSNDASIAQSRATRRYARRLSAPRRAAIRRERALHDRPADPPSGDELAN